MVVIGSLIFIAILHNIVLSINEEHLLLLVFTCFFSFLVYFFNNIMHSFAFEKRSELLKHELIDYYLLHSLLEIFSSTITILEVEVIDEFAHVTGSINQLREGLESHKAELAYLSELNTTIDVFLSTVASAPEEVAESVSESFRKIT